MENKEISLCLGGGGARGYIHIGVLRYLEENEYTITEVSGTSMGAIIAAAISMGVSSQEIYDFLKSEFSYWRLIDFSVSKGLLSGNKIYKKLSEIYGKAKVSATNIPLKITATRLSDLEKVVFSSESIADAVRASMSVPGLFKPHVIDGESYVDGMLTENLPLSSLSGNNILAVSTVMSHAIPYNNPKQILTKAFNKANADNEDLSMHKLEKDKDITMIRPVYDQIDFMDFHKFDEAIQIGYDAAKKVLENEGS